ncbi:hypothetical protein [Scytonema sp. PCC 10023]|uniref:hypothetical protein n=1 Tax=Scytonema sp. PCC 10023 TaxID=1680591 RepID=UPI0039C5C4D5
MQAGFPRPGDWRWFPDSQATAEPEGCKQFMMATYKLLKYKLFNVTSVRVFTYYM